MLSNLLSRFRAQKASKGFDFLGKRILPIGILPSQAVLFRRQAKTVRLYEQGASKKRIWTYWVRWLGWAGGLCICIPAFAPAFAVEHITTGRYANPDSGEDVWVSFKHYDDDNLYNYPYGAFQGGVSDTCDVEDGAACDTADGASCPPPGGVGVAATTSSEITTGTTISTITFAAPGVDLVSTGVWCLIKDGNGNYWSINRAPGGNYTTGNAATYIKPCLGTYTFDSSTGCAAPPAPPPVGASIDIGSGGKPVRYSREVILDH